MPKPDHQPLTRAALAQAGDRLIAHGFCTVDGASVAQMGTLVALGQHMRGHVECGDAITQSVHEPGSHAVWHTLTSIGAAKARARAESERAAQTPYV